MCVCVTACVRVNFLCVTVRVAGCSRITRDSLALIVCLTNVFTAKSLYRIVLHLNTS